MLDTPASPEDAIAAERLAARIARLEVLADIWQGLSLRLQREVRESEVGQLDMGAAALSFSRLSKAVRQTIALQARLEADHAAAKTAAQAARAECRPAPPPRVSAPTRRDLADAVVEQAVADAAGADEAAYGRLVSEADERLDALDEDLGGRPIGAVAAEICEALGVDPDWALWRDEDWATQEATTGAAGSPFARAGEAATGPALAVSAAPPPRVGASP
jgi:hypothetical protein